METDQSRAASLAYLVHDLDDAAVRRRVDLLAGEGFVVGLGGFRRHPEEVTGATGAYPPSFSAHTTSGCGVLDLGQTMDARLGQRLVAVTKRMLSPGTMRDLCAGAPVIVARNLEMLVLAWRIRRPQQRLVYECLDIHRLMLGSGGKSRLMRWIERRLLARTDLVIVSSPAFARDYFATRQGRRERVLLVENKVPVERRAVSAVERRVGDGTVWTIGWFGMLRCRKTLEQLAGLAASSRGRIKVVIAGIASPAEFPDFPAQVAALPGLRYLGPFRQNDLASLYDKVDFVWAIDYFEQGLNSDWLLPNRLYEGLANGVPPIALKGVETGRWLQQHGVGVLVHDPVAELPELLANLTSSAHGLMGEAIAILPEHALYQTSAERREIVAAIAGHARNEAIVCV
ncbi:MULTISPECIES: glycosyltransferase [unclassified Novosphingobium]|uniref:glycosyltransferase n=1 Tax=unclassified Novosphingobium TaxID=2644732 RepID=UPI00135CC237|nr:MULTISPECIES: glycosyltransferase [unclassified Novosphingobium]